MGGTKKNAKKKKTRRTSSTPCMTLRLLGRTSIYPGESMENRFVTICSARPCAQLGKWLDGSNSFGLPLFFSLLQLFERERERETRTHTFSILRERAATTSTTCKTSQLSTIGKVLISTDPLEHVLEGGFSSVYFDQGQWGWCGPVSQWRVAPPTTTLPTHCCTHSPEKTHTQTTRTK